MDNSKLNNEIQALRAIAIIFVFISHLHGLFFWNAGYWNELGKGFWVGVDLFFCVSGFVIGRSLLPSLMHARGNDFWRETGAFWVRRLYRITPSAWLWLMIPLAISPLLVHVGAAQVSAANLADVGAAILHVANLHFYSCTIGGGNCGVFSLYWSLSLEEQFYLLLPIVVFFFKKRLSFVLFAFVFIQIFTLRPQWTGILSFIRTDSILLGVLISIFSRSEAFNIFEPNLNKSRFRFIITPILISILIITTKLEIVQFYTGLAAIICSLMVWLCAYNKGYFISSRFFIKPLSWIGARSFAIYLIHIPAFWITREIWMRIEGENFSFNGTFTLRFFFTALILIAILSDLNYRFLEEPLRKLGKKHALKLLSTRQFNQHPDSSS